MFLLTYLNYAILHATRSSWALATKDFKDVYGFSSTTVSDMNATFLGFYSVGGFTLSHLGDIYNKRKLILAMYTLIALVELLLGSLQFIPPSHSHAWYFFIVKALNGFVQSFAWAVNFAILCNWFPRRGRGLLIGVWATNPSVGDIFGQQLYLAMTKSDAKNWGYTFIVLGICV